MGVVLVLTPQLFGQYLYVSVSASVASDGTILGTGVTYAGQMYVHSAYVKTTITSPNGNYSSASTSVSVGGYVAVTAQFPFDPNDLGDYTIEAEGTGW
jgi:hypothetical protein